MFQNNTRVPIARHGELKYAGIRINVVITRNTILVLVNINADCPAYHIYVINISSALSRKDTHCTDKAFSML
jgi:hypothetical protein